MYVKIQFCFLFYTLTLWYIKDLVNLSQETDLNSPLELFFTIQGTENQNKTEVPQIREKHMQCWNKTVAKPQPAQVHLVCQIRTIVTRLNIAHHFQVIIKLKRRRPAALPNPLIDGSLFLFVGVNANHFIATS